ncbi:YheC/YheD family protein [Paenibacillus sp. D2_2]|uniref:YheC/YheD family protein n=1 Tax=Paenibacillus sp. D2_2 TaxID=3073092 RepID=UPI002815268B|nr:YheC/YheD family protein [Paenibacillus sp. D2_2]WMT41034.1 YheC/YheD family protein [Paenibacillus sp. D2_2]
MAIQRIASKWEKTVILRQNELIRSYIPDTRKYSAEHLGEMLNSYGIVFIKPDNGTYGIGVMSAELWHDELDAGAGYQYKLRHGIHSEMFSTMDELHAAITSHTGRRLYLIQTGIRMLTFRRSKFDIRALVQKTPLKNWETTGFIGRLAAPQKIITNYRGGGTIMTIESLFAPHLTPKQFIALYKEMKLLGVRVAAQLARKFPNLKEIGLDLAIDEQHRIWILEVNTLPALFPFKHLNNKEIYKKIRRYAVHYGRLKSTK